MSLWRQLTRGLRSLTNRRGADQDIADEVESYLQQAAESLEANGMPADEACRTVRLHLGSAKGVCEQVRSYGWENVISSRALDVRYAARRLRHSPGFTLVCVITLAVAIGANSAIFSVINGILLKPLPYYHPNELIDLNHTAPGVNFPNARPAPFLYFTYRERGRSFQSIGLYTSDSRSVTGLAEPEQAECLDVTSEILPMLGVQPELDVGSRRKRMRQAAPNDGSDARLVAEAVWDDRSVIGRQIVVDGVSRQVIGVMPARFRFLDQNPAFLLPLQLDRNNCLLIRHSVVHG